MTTVKGYRDHDALDYAELNAGRELPQRRREPGTPRFTMPEQFEPVATSADGSALIVTCGECGSVSDPIPFERCRGVARCGDCFDWGFDFDLVAMSPEEKEVYPGPLEPVPGLPGKWRRPKNREGES